MKNAIFGNWRTSLIGTLGGLLIYLADQGLTIPSNKEGIKTFFLSLVIAAVSYFAKDAATGSKAGG